MAARGLARSGAAVGDPAADVLGAAVADVIGAAVGDPALDGLRSLMSSVNSFHFFVPFFPFFFSHCCLLSLSGVVRWHRS